MRRDSYLDHHNAGVQPDTLNKLRTANMFCQFLSPDATLWQVEEKINKHHASSSAPGPGSGASQYSSMRSDYQSKPYEKKGPKQGSQSAGDQQH